VFALLICVMFKSLASFLSKC